MPLRNQDFKPVKPTRVHDKIIQQLTQLIQDGVLQVGDRLPPERELASMLKVSRPTLRTALRVLEGMGVLEARQGQGTRIREVNLDTLMAPLAALLATQSFVIEEIMDLRSMLEPPIARVAAERAAPEDVTALTALVDRQAEMVRNREITAEEDAQFHYELAAMTGNSLLVPVVDFVMRMLAEARATWLQGEFRGEVSVAGHRRILEAVRQGDGDAAYHSMIEHIRDIEETIGQYYERRWL